MLSAGRLSWRLRLEQDVAAQDESPDWRHVADIWGEVLSTAGAERSVGQNYEAGVTSIVTIRYRSDINSRMRLVPLNQPTRFLNIARVSDPDGGQESLMLECREVA